MPLFRSDALICALRHHGEHGAVVRLLTPDHGLIAGYVRGARSRSMRPVLIPGNLVEAQWRSRDAGQLASLDTELKTSRGPWLGEPLASAALEWATSLTAAALPEGAGDAALFTALSAVLDAICHAPSARGWAVALVRYELLLLERTGFGLDLGQCVVSGAADDLAYVSPKSAQAVSRVAASGYEARLLRLPPFLRADGRSADGGRNADWADLFDGLALTGHFIGQSLLSAHRADVMAARGLLVERLKRAVA